MGTKADPMKPNEITPGYGSRNEDQNQSSGLGADGEREAEQVRQNIAQTRQEMSGTIEELHGKLNPTVLKEQAVDQFHDAKEKVLAEMREAKETLKAEIKTELANAKSAMREATIGKVGHMVNNTKDTVKDTSASMLDTVKQNPIPAAMIGVGTAWLVVNARRSGSSYSSRRLRSSMQEPGYEYGEQVGAGMHGQGLYGELQSGSQYASGDQHLYGDDGEQAGRMGSAAQAVKGKVGKVTERSTELARRAKSSISRVRQTTGERVGSMAHSVQDRGRRLENRLEQAFHENPMLVAAGALAAGTLIGLAIPITRREDAWMGRTRDGLMRKAETVAQGTLDKVKTAAERIGEESSLGGNGGNQPAGGTRNGSTSGSPSMPR